MGSLASIERYTLGSLIEENWGGVTVRLSVDARKSVVFFGVPSEKPGEIEYGATGFLVSYTLEGLNFTYLVTCRHAAEALAKWEDTGFVIRVNLNVGGSYLLPVTNIVWYVHPDPTVDLAVVPIGLDITRFDVKFLKIESIPRDILNGINVLPGDPINLVGLFKLRAGAKKNIPIVHTGNIAALPDADEKVPLTNPNTGKQVDVEGYLVEAQTLRGLSGAPVFIHEMVDLSFTKTTDGIVPKAYAGCKLLGMYLGAWDAKPGDVLAKDRTLVGETRVPVGVGIALPGERIRELIMNDPVLIKLRDLHLEKVKKASAAVQDSALPEPPTKIEKPSGREGFNALLDAAAHKQKKDE